MSNFRLAGAVIGITAIAALTVGSPVAYAARSPAPNPASPGVAWRVQWQARNQSDILSIAAPGPHQVWALEGAWTGRSTLYSIVRWNGRRWRVSGLPNAGFVPVEVRASAPDNVWITGDWQGQPAAEIWNGHGWRQISMPASPFDPFVVLGPSDAWAVGQPIWTSRGWATPLWRWDGSIWHRYQIPAIMGILDSLAGSSGTNLWVAAIQSRHRYSPGWLAAYHWTGTAWKQAPLRRRWILVPPAITASWTGQVWIVAYSKKAAHGIVLRHHGAQWIQLTARQLTSSPETLPGPVPFPPTAVSNHIWFFNDEYWNGRNIQPVDTISSGCQDGGPENLALTGITRTSTAAWGAECPPRKRTSPLKATIMFSKYVANLGQP